MLYYDAMRRPGSRRRRHSSHDDVEAVVPSECETGSRIVAVAVGDHAKKKEVAMMYRRYSLECKQKVYSFRKADLFLIVAMAIRISVLIISASSATSAVKESFSNMSFRPRTVPQLDEFHLSVSLVGKSVAPVLSLPFNELPKSTSKQEVGPDFGDLEFISLGNAKGDLFSRFFDPVSQAAYEVTKMEMIKMKSNETENDDSETDDCRSPNWKSDYYPNCNSFHEIDASWSHNDGETSGVNIASRLVGRGGYRNSWKLVSYTNDPWILKSLRMRRRFGKRDASIVQRDALIMDKLSSSNRIVDMFGHCGTSVFVEELDDGLEDCIIPGTGFMNPVDLDDEKEVKPQNNFTVTEKLDIALEMAESIAELHGYKDGVIVHGDIQPIQWMRTKHGKLKLGDFHRAKIMDWSESKQEYCKFILEGGANQRSPEEYDERECNEAIDVFSYSNIIYSLLTGLWMFYDNKNYDEVQKLVVAGKLPYVDDRYRTRSFVESKLVSVMERGWKYNASDRIGIFEVVSILRQVKEANKKRSNA